MDLTATDAAELTGLSLRSTNVIYQRIRCRMAEFCASQSPFKGELEADESYFGPKRIRGKRGRGAGGKTIVFGLLKRGNSVYTEIVPNASKATLQGIIRGKVDPNSISTPMVGVGTMAWLTLALISISGSIMTTMNSLEAQNTSTVLNRFGATPNIDWLNSMEWQSIRSRRISKKLSSGLTTGIKIFICLC
jgi:ISXO2-like transposase domain